MTYYITYMDRAGYFCREDFDTHQEAMDAAMDRLLIGNTKLTIREDAA